MKTCKKLLFLFCASSFLVSCAFSSVGGGVYKERGLETKSINECMGHCLSKSKDGKSCSEFSGSMAKICKVYLTEK